MRLDPDVPYLGQRFLKYANRTIHVLVHILAGFIFLDVAILGIVMFIGFIVTIYRIISNLIH